MTHRKNTYHPVGRIRKVKCSRSCGYERPYTDTAWWLDQVIDHPVYGKINGNALVQREMWDHDCGEFKAAQERFRAISGYDGRPYLTERK